MICSVRGGIAGGVRGGIAGGLFFFIFFLWFLLVKNSADFLSVFAIGVGVISKCFAVGIYIFLKFG